jgi:hypothetical protein
VPFPLKLYSALVLLAATAMGSRAVVLLRQHGGVTQIGELVCAALGVVLAIGVLQFSNPCATSLSYLRPQAHPNTCHVIRSCNCAVWLTTCGSENPLNLHCVATEYDGNFNSPFPDKD